MGVSKKVAQNLYTRLDPGATPAIFKAARLVLTNLQKGAIDQVRAIVHASPSTPAIRILINCLQSVVNLGAAGVPVEPVYQLMSDLYRRTSRRRLSGSALLKSGQDLPAPNPQTAPGDETFAGLEGTRSVFNARGLPDALSLIAPEHIPDMPPLNMKGEAPQRRIAPTRPQRPRRDVYLALNAPRAPQGAPSGHRCRLQLDPRQSSGSNGGEAQGTGNSAGQGAGNDQAEGDLGQAGDDQAEGDLGYGDQAPRQVLDEYLHGFFAPPLAKPW